MFCTKCGTELPNNSKFCFRCGNKMNEDTSAAEKATETAAETEEIQALPGADQDAAEPELEIDLTELFDQTELLDSPPVDLPHNPEPVNNNGPKKTKKPKKIGTVGRTLLLVLLCVGLLGAVVTVGLRLFGGNGFSGSYEQKIEEADALFAGGNLEEAEAAYKSAQEIDPSREEAYLGLAAVYEKLDRLEEAIGILTTAEEQIDSETITRKRESMQASLSGSKEEPPTTAGDSGGETETTPPEPTTMAGFLGEPTPVDINIRQVDNTKFPEVVFYASVTEEDGEPVKELQKKDFSITEIDTQGNVHEAGIEDVYQVLSSENIFVNLVLDASGSMSSNNKMGQAQNAANSFVQRVNLANGDSVEIISFDDFVYLDQEFTNDSNALHTAINSLYPGGGTALYDAIYAGLLQTYYEKGAKCVIAFTDGAENASSYSFNDVIATAQNTGIPVFIIGIGGEQDASELSNVAAACGGQYYSSNEQDLETILEDVYWQIYQEQQDYYVFKYTSPVADNLTEFRSINLATSEVAAYTGEYRKEYIPQADLSGNFSGFYANLDFIIADSSNRALTEADLSGLGLAELRLARNEIFARHGRQFKDSMLNKWFYSKTWYLNIGAKYAPEQFDAISPNPLSKLELENAEFIKAFENNIMNERDIFPDASTVLLSDYDLCLSKAVLKKALAQMQGYAPSGILDQNLHLVQTAIDTEDMQY